MNVEKLVGNTPMIKINYEYEGKIGSIYSKVEFYNYSGSIKDRIALYIIQKEKENVRQLLRLQVEILEYLSVLSVHFLAMMYIFSCLIGCL